MRSDATIVARCPTCVTVIEHAPEGRFYRCGSCHRAHDIMAELA